MHRTNHFLSRSSRQRWGIIDSQGQVFLLFQIFLVIDLFFINRPHSQTIWQFAGKLPDIMDQLGCRYWDRLGPWVLCSSVLHHKFFSVSIIRLTQELNAHQNHRCPPTGTKQRRVPIPSLGSCSLLPSSLVSSSWAYTIYSDVAPPWHLSATWQMHSSSQTLVGNCWTGSAGFGRVLQQILLLLPPKSQKLQKFLDRKPCSRAIKFM